MTLNPTKNNFQDILLKFSQDMSELQHNQKQYFALLTETCRQISLALNSHRILRKRLPINEVKIYMSHNFSNPNLNLACTARQFDVSEGYLSSCFKEATGICFADHLENIRIKSMRTSRLFRQNHCRNCGKNRLQQRVFFQACFQTHDA